MHVVLRDFVNDDIIGILPNRHKGTFENYFYKIQRKDAHILGSPIPIKDIRSKYKTNRKRGCYNKQ